MKKFISTILICFLFFPVICNAEEMTITGVFESGTRYAPATFGYEDDLYAFDADAIGTKWQKFLNTLISTCENNTCDVRANVVPDKNGQYKGIIKSIRSIKINRSAG